MAVKPSVLASILFLVLAAAPGLRAADDEAKWKDLASRLADSDFATRNAAQKELAKVDWHSLAILKKFAEQEQDLEAASRLKSRVIEIEEEAFTDPHPINVDVEGMNLQGLAAALSKALNVNIDATGVGPDNVFTLHAKEKPFWEICRELSAQRPISFQNYSTSAIRLFNGNGDFRRMTVSGPVAIVPEFITRTRRANLTAPPGGELETEQLTFQYQVMVDPRVRVVSYREPLFTEIVDSKGANLLNNAPARGVSVITTRNAMLVTSFASVLSAAAQPTKFARARGSFWFTASVGEATATLEGAEKKAGETVQLGSVGVKLSRFDVLDNSINATFARDPATPANPGDPNPPITIEVTDANGRRLWLLSLTSGSIGGGYSGAAIAKPLKVKFSMPTKVKEITVPFELKDLPIP